MNLPTPGQCLAYFEKYHVPKNIQAHCLKVQQVSVFLATQLNAAGYAFNIPFVSALSILHDIFKAVVIEKLGPSKYHLYTPTKQEIASWKRLREKFPGMHEGDVAFEIFKKDYPELALSLKKTSNPHILNKSPEESLVHYCDWRVLRDEVISFDARVKYIQEVYHSVGSRQEEIALMKQFETKIFQSLGYLPTDLKQKQEKSLDNS